MKKRPLATAGIAAVAIGLACPLVGACAVTHPVPTSDSSSAGPSAVTVSASDDACVLSGTDATTGPSTFVVTNDGTKVTEFYVYGAGGRVMGELENIAPGLQRKLSVRLTQPGTYQTVCRPGMIGVGVRGTFTVTGDAVPMNAQDQLVDAAAGYKRYVGSQTGALVAATAAFVGAVKKGDVVGAAALYPTTHAYYGRIKLAAASFPDDLDARIDAHEDDANGSGTWTGFHRLERDVFVAGLQPDTNVIADQLLADVKKLDADVTAPAWTIDPVQLAAGAGTLLRGIAAYAISGADEAFSHTDPWDFQAAAVGSATAMASLRATLDARNPDVGPRMDEQFGAVDYALTTLRDGDGFAVYDRVQAPARGELSQVFAALAEVMEQVRATFSG